MSTGLHTCHSNFLHPGSLKVYVPTPAVQMELLNTTSNTFLMFNVYGSVHRNNILVYNSN